MMTGRHGISGVWIGLVCVAAIVASATAWSAVRRAEVAEMRATDLSRIIREKDAAIGRLQSGVGDVDVSHGAGADDVRE